MLTARYKTEGGLDRAPLEDRRASGSNVASRVRVSLPRCNRMCVRHDTTQIGPTMSLNYATHAYLTVLLAPSASLLADPSAVHPHLKHVGPVSLTSVF